MNQNVRKITDGAMMTGLVGLVLFFNRQTAGMFEYMFSWLLSFPILIYTAKYGGKAAIIPAISMLLLSLMLSMPTTIFYLCSALIIGLSYGIGVRYRFENRILLGITIIFTLISYIITTIIYAELFGYSSDDIQLLLEFLDMLSIHLTFDIRRLALAVSILLALIMSVLEGLCIHLIAVILLKRLKVAEIKVKSIIDMQPPKWLAYISIIVILLFLGRNVVELDNKVLTIITCAMTVVMLVGLVNGVLYLMCVLIVMGKRKWVMILPLLAITPVIQYLILFFGIYDMFIGGKHIIKEALINGTIGKS